MKLPIELFLRTVMTKPKVPCDVIVKKGKKEKEIKTSKGISPFSFLFHFRITSHGTLGFVTVNYFFFFAGYKPVLRDIQQKTHFVYF